MIIKLPKIPYRAVGAVAILGAIVFVAYKQHDAAQKYKSHRTEYCSSLSIAPDQKKSCIEEGASARDYLPWWFVVVSWPDGINAWAIIATGGFIAWQSWETRQSARATRDSVSAIHRQIEMARDKDRAKITITAESLTLVTGIGWAITGRAIIRNIGSTRAFNIRFETELIWYRVSETPGVPLYEPAVDIDGMESYLDVTAKDDPKRSISALFYDSTRDQDWIANAIYTNQIRFRMYMICSYETVGSKYRRSSVFDWIPANTPGLRALIHSPYENTPAGNNFDKISSGYWQTVSDSENEQ
jgi:hypothetical protein